MTDHPITPPPELIRKWLNDFHFPHEAMGLVHMHIATRAAQWGADQELEACLAWLKSGGIPSIARPLYERRRPKPPTLKEQALEQLRALDQQGALECNTDTIRRALQTLDD
jgi:hypothetical protein